MQRRQFVILEHDHPYLHWDLLIEDGDFLASWRLLDLPHVGMRARATPLPVHRREYLIREGPVSGNRGSVRRLHAGWLELDGIWPDVTDWPDILLRIVECPLARSCRLIRNGHDLLYWEFG